MSQKDYIEKIKNAKESYYVRSTVKIYINKEYNIYNLMNLDISDDKKMALYETIIQNQFDSSFYYHIISEKDKILFLKAFCYVNPDKYGSYYRMLSEINDPVNEFSVGELNILTKYVKIYGWQDLEETIGFEKASSIINKIVSFDNICISCDVIKYASDENKNKILKTACNSISSFKIAYDKFEDKYKEELINYYFDNSINDYEISEFLIKNKLVKDDITKIENSTSTVIYLYLMNNNLSKEEEKRLEKALLKTNDFEYIIYYYFYKNKYMFHKLFVTFVIFLAFIKLNEEKFKNKTILNNIIDKIKNDMDWFNEYVDDAYEYQKTKYLK